MRPPRGRRADIRPGPQAAVDTSMDTDNKLATCAGHEPSGGLIIP